MEKWAAVWRVDIRTIRSDVRALLGERDDGGEKIFKTLPVAGRRIIGTPRAFRNRERTLYGQFHLDDYNHEASR